MISGQSLQRIQRRGTGELADSHRSKEPRIAVAATRGFSIGKRGKHLDVAWLAVQYTPPCSNRSVCVIERGVDVRSGPTCDTPPHRDIGRHTELTVERRIQRLVITPPLVNLDQLITRFDVLGVQP
jgi:hypothetical protein